MRIPWVRVIGGGFLLEVVLFAVLVPIQFVSRTLFLIAVPIGCFAFGYIVARLMLRGARGSVVLNAVLLGIVATAIYLAIVVSTPDGVQGALNVYGAPLFLVSNAMRVVGCATAGLQLRRLSGSSGAAGG